MSTDSFLPGWRFHPTDAECIAYYLKKKIQGRSDRRDPITVADVFKIDPEELPVQHGDDDQARYFYSVPDRKFSKGSRKNRATLRGYWKSTGNDRFIQSQYSQGMKKTLVYYRGRVSKGERTDWVMHEYRMADEFYQRLGGEQIPYVLVRIVKKNGPGPDNGVRHWGSFVEDPPTPPQNSAQASSSVLESIEPSGESLEDHVDKEDLINEEFIIPGDIITRERQSIFHVPSDVEDVVHEGNGLTWEEILGSKLDGVPSANEDWREEVIDSNVINDNDFVDSLLNLDDIDYDFENSLIFPPPLDSAVGIGMDDYLEMNDLTDPSEESSESESSKIQLLPRSTFVARDSIFEGSISQRIRLVRRERSKRKVVEISVPEPSAPDLLSMNFHRSVSASELAAFVASCSARSFDLQRLPQDLPLDCKGGCFHLSSLPLWDPAQRRAKFLQSQSDSGPTVYSRAHDRVQPEPNTSKYGRPKTLTSTTVSDIDETDDTVFKTDSTDVTVSHVFFSARLENNKNVAAAVLNLVRWKLRTGVLSGIMKPCIEENKQQGYVQPISRRYPQTKVVHGSQSGIVFAFILGVVSSCVWFFLFQKSWRIAKLIFGVFL